VINAGPTDAVSLVGLTIEGAGVGTIGIQFNSGQSLTVKNCVIRHLSDNGGGNNGSGIVFAPSANSNLFVSDTVTSDNDLYGIFVSIPGSGSVSAVFNHVEANNNQEGMVMDDGSASATINATVTDSVVSGNTFAGFYNGAGSSAPATLTVFHSVVANNNYGLYNIGSLATLRLANTVVTGNTTSWANNGTLSSYGDNYIDGNADSNPGPNVIPRK
jgi:hypothetical protein